MMRRWLWLLLLPAALLLPPRALAACTYSVSTPLNFGTVVGMPGQIDSTASITVTCPLLARTRVCLSMPAGLGMGSTVADRRMSTGSNFVQFQLYTDAARTQVLGAHGGSPGPFALDFPLVGGTQTATIYGRVFSGQTGKSVGTYLSNFTTIQAREQTYALLPPTCNSIGSAPIAVSTITSQLIITPGCTIVANNLNFGTASGLAANLDASSTLQVTCTLNGAYTVALNGGTITGNVSDRRMQKGAGPDQIGYQLYRDSGRTLVWGETPSRGGANVVAGTGDGLAQTLTVFGRVPAQAAKPPGAYLDTVTATITF